jgi:SHS2 domain-containing protein
MYRWIEHTAELELALEASDERQVFADALTAFAELVDTSPSGAHVRHEITLRSPERATLLADWLGELVFLAETEFFVPERVVELELESDELRATVEGRVGEPPHLVKAVTYHGLEFEKEEGWVRAQVVLDV